jgi:hypothetical protein
VNGEILIETNHRRGAEGAKIMLIEYQEEKTLLDILLAYCLPGLHLSTLRLCGGEIFAFQSLQPMTLQPDPLHLSP